VAARSKILDFLDSGDKAAFRPCSMGRSRLLSTEGHMSPPWCLPLSWLPGCLAEGAAGCHIPYTTTEAETVRPMVMEFS
jgi:hypothetical protein